MLQLAKREGLVDAADIGFNWRLLDNYASYVSNDISQTQLGQKPRLLLQTEPELQLVFEILKIGDRYFLTADHITHQDSNQLNNQGEPDQKSVSQWRKSISQSAHKSAYDLALSCLRFYEHCPLFVANPTLSNARIGLFALTHKLIKFLVGEHIDLPEQL
jgi:hypothetical protein